MPAGNTRVNRTTGKAAPQPGDVTALRTQALEDERNQEQAEAQQRVTMAREVEEYEKQNVVIDYSDVDNPLPEVQPLDGEDERPFREVTIKYDIDQMTFGVHILREAEYDERGNCTRPADVGGPRFFSFKEGRRYRLPKPLADHLDERGFVFH